MASLTSPFAQRLETLDIRESRIHADGVNTTYWEYGDPDAETTIILVHGFRGDHHGLEPFVAFLGQRVRCIVPDLPGFGATGDFPLGASIDAYASWLISFSTQVGRSPNTIILGHSFGSIVVSAALAKGLNPTKVILVNPIAVNALHGPRGFLTRLAVGYYHLAAALPEKLGFSLLKNRLIVRIMSVTMAKTRDKELRAWIHDQHDQYFSHFSTRKGVMEAFETSVSHDVSEYVAGIPQPVLVLAAEDDDITEIKHQHALVAALPDARIEVVPSVGHLIHYEAPEWAAEHILEFISGGVVAHPIRVGFDARYIRTDHHDGISRFSARVGSELALLCAGNDTIDLTFLVSDEKQLTHLPAGCSYRVISSPTSVRERRVARAVNTFGFDTVFSPMQTMGSRGRTYKLILTVHDLIYYRHPMPPRQFSWPLRLLWRLYHLSWWPQRWLLNSSDAVVAVSETTKALIAEHNLTTKPVFVVYNAAEELTPTHSAQRSKSLVYMGSFMPYKNVETLVDVANQLPEYELHLLSRIHHRDRARLEALTTGSNVSFHNGVTDDEYSSILARSQAAVTASLDEGFGIPVIEAMSIGTPVVCSDIPIFREIGSDAALFANPRSSSEFVSAIRSLENADFFAQAQSRSIRAAGAFSWKQSAQRLFDVLIEVSTES